MVYTLYQAESPWEMVKIDLPDAWETEISEMAGDHMPALTRQGLKKKLDSPCGSLPIKQLAAGKETAVIVFDDISRGTRLQNLAELVVEELLEAGIKEENIEFLCALGNHGAMTRIEFAKKLGESLVSRFPVFNHNPYENNVRIGTTFNGIPVEINREFAESDVRIGIGAITPHPLNGFGGGGKLLFPGIASITTTTGNHQKKKYGCMAQADAPAMRKEIEEMVEMAGPFFKIDVLYNASLDIVDVFAGDPIQEYYEGIQRAAEVYKSRPLKDKDVVIANANAKVNEADIAILTAASCLKKTGGDIVLVNYCPYGQVVHYFSGPFGRKACGRQWSPMGEELEHVGKIICLSPYPDKYSTLRFGDVNGTRRVVWARTWEEVLKLLEETHKGKVAAGVLSDGTIQYF